MTVSTVSAASIVIARKQLADALARIDSTVPHRSPKESLRCVKISVNGHARLSATDLEISHHEFLQCDHNGELELQLNAKQLRKIVTSSKAKELHIELDCNSCKVDSSSLQAVDSEKMPMPLNMLESSLAGECKILGSWCGSGDSLANMLEFVAIATDPDSSRFSMGAVCFEFLPDNKLRVIGTDGRRLHVASEVSDSVSPIATDLVYGGHAVKMAKAARKADLAKIELTINEWIDSEGREVKSSPVFRVNFYSNGDRFSSYIFRLVEGRFPNWQQVIPRGHDSLATINSTALASVSLQASRQAEGKPDPTGGRFVISGDKIDIDYRNESKTVAFKLAVDCVSSVVDRVAVRLDCHYVSQAANCMEKALQSRMVDFYGATTKTHASPVMLSSDRNEVTYRAVIMPMAIGK